MRRLVGWLVVCVWLIGSVAATAYAAKPARRTKPAAVAPVRTGLFEAMKANQIMAGFVPRDSEAARISLLNVSKTPLEVELPSVFAGAPVAALATLQPAETYLPADSQSSLPQILGSVIPTSYANTATQSGGMHRSKGQAPATKSAAAKSSDSQPSTATSPSTTDQQPTAVQQLTTDHGPPTTAVTILLQPRQMRQFAVPCVCLQYGNPTPSPDVAYQLVALDSVSGSPQLRALLDEFSLGRLDQPIVQLAAWHFSNNLSWEQLGSTGLSTVRLAQAERLATLIEDDVSRKQTKDGPQPFGQTTSPGSQSQQSIRPTRFGD